MTIPPGFLGRLAWFIVKCIGRTLTIDVIGRVKVPEGNPIIYVLWHGRLFFPMYCYLNQGITVLVSEHRDGDIITASLDSAGYETVRGSTTRGGVRALAQMVKLVKQGRSVAFTPDGPRGPKWHFQPGAVYVAAKTGAPIVPMGGSSRKAYYFSSWDSFQLPLPFSRGVLAIGDPYYVTGELNDAALEFHRSELERRLIQLNRDADSYIGASEV